MSEEKKNRVGVVAKEVETFIQQSTNLTSTDFALYMGLLWFENKDSHECFPSIKTLSRTTKLNQKTINKSIKKLVAMGLITYEKGMKGRSNIYTVLQDGKKLNYDPDLTLTQNRVSVTTECGGEGDPKTVVSEGQKRLTKDKLKDKGKDKNRKVAEGGATHHLPPTNKKQEIHNDKNGLPVYQSSEGNSSASSKESNSVNVKSNPEGKMKSSSYEEVNRVYQGSEGKSSPPSKEENNTGVKTSSDNTPTLFSEYENCYRKTWAAKIPARSCTDNFTKHKSKWTPKIEELNEVLTAENIPLKDYFNWAINHAIKKQKDDPVFRIQFGTLISEYFYRDFFASEDYEKIQQKQNRLAAQQRILNEYYNRLKALYRKTNDPRYAVTVGDYDTSKITLYEFRKAVEEYEREFKQLEDELRSMASERDREESTTKYFDAVKQYQNGKMRFGKFKALVTGKELAASA